MLRAHSLTPQLCCHAVSSLVKLPVAQLLGGAADGNGLRRPLYLGFEQLGQAKAARVFLLSLIPMIEQLLELHSS